MCNNANNASPIRRCETHICRGFSSFFFPIRFSRVCFLSTFFLLVLFLLRPNTFLLLNGTLLNFRNLCASYEIAGARMCCTCWHNFNKFSQIVDKFVFKLRRMKQFKIHLCFVDWQNVNSEMNKAQINFKIYRKQIGSHSSSLYLRLFGISSRSSS